jgi:hypothetical protein
MRWIHKEFLKENLAPNQAGKVTLVSVNVEALLTFLQYKLNTVHHLQHKYYQTKEGDKKY